MSIGRLLHRESHLCHDRPNVEMKTIEIDEDIYEYLRKNNETIGEDASSILRRLLGLEKDGTRENERIEHFHKAAIEENSEYGDQSSAPDQAEADSHRNNVVPDSVGNFLRGRSFRVCESATDRYLEALSWIYSHHRDEFDKILTISGTERIYFASSEIDIANSGNATQPRPIPGSPWFALTNNDTANKSRLVRRVMCLFHYPIGDIERITNAVIRGV